MIIRVDPKSDTPIFQQIVDGVKSAIARGSARPGEPLPSVRQMAGQSLVNPNTVAKAYRDLEREGVITTRKGLGVFVADTAVRLCRQDRRADIGERLTDIVSEAQSAGIAPKEIRSALDDALSRHADKSRKDQP